MQKLFRTLVPLLLLMMTVISAPVVWAVQSGAVVVDPPSGEQEDTFTIQLDGLQANTEYEIHFIFADTGETVFRTRQTTDNNGQSVFSIVSEASDAPGIYLVEVVAGGEVVAEGQFTLTSSTGSAPDTTPSQAPESTGTASVQIVPRSAPIGGVYNILVGGLEPNQNVAVEITNPAGEQVYSRLRTADESGRFQVEIFTQDGDSPGDYTVAVVEQGGTVLGTGRFVIEEPIGQNGVIAITPESAPAGSTFIINVTDLKPFADLRVNIKTGASNIPVFTTMARASVDGVLVIEFESETDLEEGNYIITISEGDTVVAEGDFNIGQAVAADAVALDVSPTSGVQGTTYVVNVTGLVPLNQLTLDVLDPSGEVAYTTDRTADASGNFTIRLSTSDEDATGTYTVNIRQNGDVIASGDFVIDDTVITQPDTNRIVLNVTPQNAAAGTPRIVTAAGFEPGEIVTIEVTTDDTMIFSETFAADVNGAVAFSVPLAADTAAGDYDVRIVTGEEVVAQLPITVAEQVVQDDPPASNVQLTVMPQSGPIGTAYTITATGLEANETVVFNVAFDGNVVFARERTANAEGRATLNIASEQGDTVGEYTATVTRNDVTLAEAKFNIGETATTPTGDVIITVDPEAAPRESSHRILISGLEANETVTVSVVFEGETVFETTRDVDADGNIEIILASSPDDKLGVYDVQVLRDDMLLADASLIIEGQADEPQDEVEIVVEPQTAVIGTTHTVTVTGLDANETVTLEALYDGEVDFSTQLTADADGVATIALAAAEGDPTGDYTLTILRDGDQVAETVLTVEPFDTVTPPEQGPDTAQQTDGEEVMTGSISTSQPEREITFEGQQGQAVYITLTSNDFDTYLVLLDDEGFELAFDDDSAGELNSLIGPYVLPYTGTYTLIVSSYEYTQTGEPVGGSYELTINRVQLAQLGDGMTETAAISFDGRNNERFFTFEANLGDVIAISATSTSTNEVDTTLSLTDPDNLEVVFDDDGGPGFDPEINRYVVAQSGTYIIALNTFFERAQGDVELTLTREAARSLNDGAQPVRISGKQSTDVVRYEGTAGETVRLTVRRISGQPEDLYIDVSQGDAVLMTYSTRGLPDEISLGFVVPDDGTVGIFVQDFGFGTTLLELEVED